MEKPNFADLPAEDLLTWIETAQKALDQKIAAEKAEINARQIRLAKLEARRAGKEAKPNRADKADKVVKAKTESTIAKPRGRPASAASPKQAVTLPPVQSFPPPVQDEERAAAT